LRQYQKPTIAGVSPVDLTSKVNIPMLVIHGDYDTTVPVEHSRRFVEGLKATGADIEYIEIEDMGHSPVFFEQSMQWYPQLFEFFDTKCGFNPTLVAAK
jgi:dipeptidyl aminopeptidase/acylaminoacyl peptidase